MESYQPRQATRYATYSHEQNNPDWAGVLVAVRPLDRYPPVLVPVLVFLTCVTAGVVTAARRLPDLGEGTVGGLAFLVVCGLLGAALGLVGLHIYTVVHDIGRFGGSANTEIVAQGLAGMLWEAGSLLGIAAAVYTCWRLLANPTA
jgi:hypothetical protein